LSNGIFVKKKDDQSLTDCHNAQLFDVMGPVSATFDGINEILGQFGL
jgi:hypothetical protein